MGAVPGEKAWTLEPRPDGLATVFMMCRDRAGNDSDVAAASYIVDPDLPRGEQTWLPYIEP